MNLIHEITMRSYALIKRNPRLKAFVLPLYRVASALAARVRLFTVRKSPAVNVTITVCKSVAAWVTSSGGHGNWCKEIHPATTVQRPVPKTVGPVHWKFMERQSEVLPSTFVACLHDARIWEDCKVITTDNQLLAEVSKEIVRGEYHELPMGHELYTGKILLPLEKLQGRTAVLSAPSGRGYYHWMFDVLPRLDLIRRAGVDWNNIDCFLVNDYITRFHIETLHQLGLVKRKIRSSHWHPYLKAEELIIPSLVGNTGHIPRWTCDFLRTSFLRQRPGKVNGINHTTRSLRLYLSRGQVAHRRVVNEQEVIDMLHRFGFRNILLESLSFAEQVAMLNSASVVVAPHGAGLTNIVFCNPGTRVIEILSPRAVNIMYWTLCSQIDLDYYYLLAEGTVPPDHEDRYENSEDLKIDIGALAGLLEVSGIR